VKIKLDENIGKRGLELLRSRGHDTSTVYEQGLSGAVDEQVFGICAEEGRVLITLDRDFGEVLRFPRAEAQEWSSWPLAHAQRGLISSTGWSNSSW
jgi:predicted nuclease of predicted toxin-antitoxin system